MSKSLKDIIGPKKGRLERYEKANKKQQAHLSRLEKINMYQIKKHNNVMGDMYDSGKVDLDKIFYHNKKKTQRSGDYSDIVIKRSKRQRMLNIARARINDKKEQEYKNHMKGFRYD